MTFRDLQTILGADLICGEEYLDTEATGAFASDFMSDVLAFSEYQNVLLSGMINPQVIRTAQMMDIQCIIFVRGKRPNEEIISLAENNDMVVLAVEETMFVTSGKLYAAGLR